MSLTDFITASPSLTNQLMMQFSRYSSTLPMPPPQLHLYCDIDMLHLYDFDPQFADMFMLKQGTSSADDDTRRTSMAISSLQHCAFQFHLAILSWLEQQADALESANLTAAEHTHCTRLLLQRQFHTYITNVVIKPAESSIVPIPRATHVGMITIGQWVAMRCFVEGVAVEYSDGATTLTSVLNNAQDAPKPSLQLVRMAPAPAASSSGVGSGHPRITFIANWSLAFHWHTNASPADVHLDTPQMTADSHLSVGAVVECVGVFLSSPDPLGATVFHVMSVSAPLPPPQLDEHSSTTKHISSLSHNDEFARVMTNWANHFTALGLGEAHTTAVLALLRHSSVLHILVGSLVAVASASLAAISAPDQQLRPLSVFVVVPTGGAEVAFSEIVSRWESVGAATPTSVANAVSTSHLLARRQEETNIPQRAPPKATSASVLFEYCGRESSAHSVILTSGTRTAPSSFLVDMARTLRLRATSSTVMLHGKSSSASDSKGASKSTHPSLSLTFPTNPPARIFTFAPSSTSTARMTNDHKELLNRCDLVLISNNTSAMDLLTTFISSCQHSPHTRSYNPPNASALSGLSRNSLQLLEMYYLSCRSNANVTEEALPLLVHIALAHKSYIRRSTAIEDPLDVIDAIIAISLVDRSIEAKYGRALLRDSIFTIKADQFEHLHASVFSQLASVQHM